MMFMVTSFIGVLHSQCTTPVPVPFTETFDNGALPACWVSQNPTNATTNSNLNWKFTGTTGYGTVTALNGRPYGTFAWVDASSPYTGEHTVELITPQINLAGLTNPYIQFDWFKNHSNSTAGTGGSTYDDNKIIVAVDDGGGYVTIFTGTTNSSEWRTEGVALAASYINRTITVKFTVDKDVAGNGYFYDDLLLDNVQVRQAPTCFIPSTVVSSNPSTTTVDLTWIAPSVVPALGYEIYYNTTNVAPISTTTPSVTGINTASATVGGLVPSTTYFIWVRSNCSSSDSSDWVSGTSFSTNCVAFNVPYSENFDTTATGTSSNNNAPQCWSYLESAGSTGYGYVSSSNSNSAPNNFYMYNSSDIAGHMLLVSPETNNLASGNNRVRFFARGASDGFPIQVGTLSNPTDPTSFTMIGSPIILTNVHTEYTVDLPAGTNKFLAFRHGMATTYDAIYIDDINVEAIPSCVRPTDVIVASVTATSADLSWIAPAVAPANGYEVYYSTTNTAPTAASVAQVSNINSTSATITGLTAATTYYFWVRSVCGPSESSIWTTDVSATTNCVAFTIPYSENFDTTSTGTTTNNNTPQCWSYLETPNSAAYAYVSTSNNNSAPNSFYMYNSTDVTGDMMLVSPVTTNLSSGLNRVRFFAKGSVAGYPLEIGTLSNSLDPSTFTIIGSPIILTTTQTEYTVDIPVGTNVNLAFRHGMNSTYDAVYLDDINVEAIPSCVRPTVLVVASTTATSADVSWTASASAPANGYQIYYSTTNTQPTAGSIPQITNITGTSATISGLSAATDYFFWVRSACSTSDLSFWTDAETFTTQCSVFTAPFYEGFSNGTIPNCWTNVNPTTTSTSANVLWKFIGSPGYGSTSNGRPTGSYAWVDASTPNTGENTVQMITPMINLTPLTTPYVQFDWFKNNENAGSDNELKVAINDGTGWVDIFTSTTNDPSWRTVGIPLAASYIGATVQLKFNVNKDFAGAGNFYDDLLVDEVRIIDTPTCIQPGGVSTSGITGNSATINWIAPTPAPASGYDVYYSTVNVPPTASTTPNLSGVMALNTPISGLTALTDYYVWVRSNCSAADQSVWVGGTLFTTGCATIVPTYVNDFATFPGTCWERASGGTPATGPNGTTNYWLADGFLNNGTSGSAKIQLFSNVRTGWLFSPTFDLSSGTYRLKFDYGVTETTGTAKSSMGSDDVVQILMSVNGGATWTAMQTWDANTGPGATLNSFNMPINTNSNQVKFAFYGTDGAVDDIENYNFYVDNFMVESQLATVEIAKDDLLQIYPNPFTDFIRISDVKNVETISIIDLSGRLIKTMKPTNEINLSSLKAGMYLINLKMKDGSVQTVKTIKK